MGKQHLKMEFKYSISSRYSCPLPSDCCSQALRNQENQLKQSLGLSSYIRMDRIQTSSDLMFSKDHASGMLWEKHLRRHRNCLKCVYFLLATFVYSAWARKRQILKVCLGVKPVPPEKSQDKDGGGKGGLEWLPIPQKCSEMSADTTGPERL